MTLGSGNALKAFGLAALLLGMPAAQAQDAEPRAPFITTPPDVVERMLRFAGTREGDVVLDLGSGDGRIVIEAALKFGARGIGIELDPGLVEKSRERVREAKLAERVAIVHGDVLQADISKASVVTVYLLPSLIGRLQPRFIDELQPGTRIVSHAFYMPSWKADRTERMRIARRHDGQGDESSLYLWIVPAKARGLWEESAASPGWQLRVHQNFQEIEVEARYKGSVVPVTGASLSGTQLAWEGPAFAFRGRVEGDSIIGEVLEAGRSVPVVLRRKP